MYRRRRCSREIQFSFDSFLDVVANVCGIIIRLILVAWVGGRSYHTVAAHLSVTDPPATHAAPVQQASIDQAKITDPLEQELQRHRDELEKQQQKLLEQLRQHQQLQAVSSQANEQLTALTGTEATLADQRGKLAKTAKEQSGAAQTVLLTLAELEQRSGRLTAELRELENMPPTTKTLRYRTPVSRPVHSEELHFECREGRICFIDLQAFLIEIRHGFEDKGNLLKTQWEVDGTTGPVGAFRLRYTVERQRGPLDVTGGVPAADTAFRYGLQGWVLEPITQSRGETADAALTPGSQFRRLVDALDPELTVVTLWVYSDSFGLYRQVRDYLHEHNIEVAGRPLPPGMPIASSRSGSASRGQ